MKIFRNLYISANAETMESAVAEMEKSLPDGWTRERSAGARVWPIPSSTSPMTYRFTRKKERGVAAMLVLVQKDPETFHVSNIIPINRHQLEHAEYNEILEDFYEHV